MRSEELGLIKAKLVPGAARNPEDSLPFSDPANPLSAVVEYPCDQPSPQVAGERAPRVSHGCSPRRFCSAGDNAGGQFPLRDQVYWQDTAPRQFEILLVALGTEREGEAAHGIRKEAESTRSSIEGGGPTLKLFSRRRWWRRSRRERGRHTGHKSRRGPDLPSAPTWASRFLLLRIAPSRTVVVLSQSSSHRSLSANRVRSGLQLHRAWVHQCCP